MEWEETGMKGEEGQGKEGIGKKAGVKEIHCKHLRIHLWS